MQIETKRVRISMSLAFVVLLAVSANISEGKIYLLTLMFSLFHECIHILFLFCFGCERVSLRLSPGGIKMSGDSLLSLTYREIFICSISAPVMNLAAGVLFYYIGKKTAAELFYTASYINFSIGLMNLLPLSFLDGGRALSAVLRRSMNITAAVRAEDILSVSSLFIIGCFVFMLIIRGRFLPFLLIFFVYCTSGYVYSKKNGIT